MCTVRLSGMLSDSNEPGAGNPSLLFAVPHVLLPPAELPIVLLPFGADIDSGLPADA